MRGYARVRGLRRLIVPVPVLTPALSSYWIGLVTPVPHTIGRLLIDGLRNPVVVRSRSGTGPVSADCAAELCGGGAAGGRAAGVGRCRDDLDHGAWRSARGGAATGPSPRGRGPGDGAARTVGERLPGRGLPHLQWHRGTWGWFYADWLWRLRGLLDRIVGGVGLRRGSARPQQAAAGRSARLVAGGGSPAGPGPSGCGRR